MQTAIAAPATRDIVVIGASAGAIERGWIYVARPDLLDEQLPRQGRQPIRPD